MPFVGSINSPTIGEVVVLATTVVVIAWFLYFANAEPTETGALSSYIKMLTFADTAHKSGALTSYLSSLTFATAARNSIFSFLIGIPFERLLFWHKYAIL